MTTNELEIWKALNELPEVKKVFVEWDFGDHYVSKGDGGILCMVWNPERMSDEDFVPPLYDPIRPGRSLIGIYKKLRTDYYTKIHPPEHIEHIYRWVEEDLSNIQYRQARPDLALARAILEGKEKG